MSRKNYWRNVSPRGAVGDLLEVWRQPTPYRWTALAISLVATGGLMLLFIPESQRARPRPPEITYISVFAPDRTDAEIVASNLENQRRREQREAEFLAAEERVKEAYRQLGRASGIDVEAMERRIAEDEAAEEAAKTAARRPSPAGPASQAPSGQASSSQAAGER